MPLLGPSMAATIQGSLAGKGYVGANLASFCLAIGNGSVMSLVGRGFDTIDTGASSGSGVGVGVGLLGVSGSFVSKQIQAAYLFEFGSMGKSLPDIADAIGQALELELKKATLTSQHTPVYAGVGMIIPGSINVVAGAWADNIKSAGPTFQGADWPRLCKVIAQGCVAGMKLATGQVSITGSGSMPPVPVSGVKNGASPAGKIS